MRPDGLLRRRLFFCPFGVLGGGHSGLCCVLCHEDVLLFFQAGDVWLFSLSEAGKVRGHRDFADQRAVGEGD